MTAVEIVLIIAGIILMMGSFFITEKLSQKEVEQISKLSSGELKRILEKNMKSAEQKVEELVDDVIDRSMEIADRALEKETNMKIQDISEYADTVLESIHKNHNEVMFLYSMLNEKHSELTESAGKLEKLKNELTSLENEVGETVLDASALIKKLSEQMVSVSQKPVVSAEDLYKEEIDLDLLSEEEFEEKEAKKLMNNNQSILSMYEQGVNIRDIAKQLGMGVGEVKLVIDLYRGEES